MAKRATAKSKARTFAPKDIAGIIPPLVTPFSARGDINEGAFRKQIKFMLNAGVHGLAVGGSTGEGHTLTTEESRRLWQIAMEEAGDKIPIVAGIIVDSTAQAIERAEAAQDLGMAALQITPVHYLFRPDDEHMIKHFRDVGRASSTPIIIYNVVPWSYLSPALLIKIMRTVPQVVGVKQSAGDLKLFADLMIGAPRDARIYSAVDALLYPSFTLGAHGTIAALPTAAPHALVQLWDAVKAGDHKTALALHKKLLVLWNAMIDDNLPAAVKYALEAQGVPAGHPRAPMPPASTAQKRAIDRALKKLV